MTEQEKKQRETEAMFIRKTCTFTPELFESLERYTERLRAERHNPRLAVTDVIRELLNAALERRNAL